MPDIFTPAKRSAVMARIRGSGNRDTELRMIALFRAHGITGWRRQIKIRSTKPESPMEPGRRRAAQIRNISADFVFRRERVAVFVDGCFWHRHPGCKYAYTPKSRLEFWQRKFEQNVARDRLVTATLKKQGWRVVRVWECDLAKAARWSRLAGRVERALARTTAEIPHANKTILCTLSPSGQPNRKRPRR